MNAKHNQVVGGGRFFLECGDLSPLWYTLAQGRRICEIIARTKWPRQVAAPKAVTSYRTPRRVAVGRAVYHSDDAVWLFDFYFPDSNRRPMIILKMR